MKLKLIQTGYENFTGLLGNLQFTNGVSNDELSVETAAGISNIYRCDQVIANVDTGTINDITDPGVVMRNTAGDFNVANAPAPAGDPVTEPQE